MNTQRTALIQTALEGVRLPANRSSLIEYMRSQDASLVPALEQLPERDYDRLDAVAEALLWPSRADAPSEPAPAPESGLPPGGDDYLRPFGTPGAVRHDAPPRNPPEKAIDQATELREAQARRQR